MALERSGSYVKLYRKEDLLREYKKSTENHEEKLLAMVKKTLVPFVSMGILTDEKKQKWTEEDHTHKTEKRFNRLIKEVLQSESLDCFIKFTRALTFRNKITEIQHVYPFVPHLFEVGLVDPLQEKSDIKLVPRNAGQGKPVVLFLVRDREKSDCVKRLLPSTTAAHASGFNILKCSSDLFELHVAYSEEKCKAPGRKYNALLAKYDPCPSLIVCLTECLLSEEEEAASREQIFLVSSFSQSQYDKTAEARHITRLFKLCKYPDHMQPKVCPKTIEYLSRVEVCTRQATRYAGVQRSSVHCPDAANFHYASKISTIPAIAVARVISEQNNDTSQEEFYCFVNDIVKYLL